MKNALFLFFSLASASALAFDVQAEEKSTNTAQHYALKGLAHAELFPGLTNLCDIEAEIRDLSKRKRSSASGKKKKSGKSRSSAIPATKVFDNLYYVGTGGVSSWVIETSDGLILIDALNTVRQAKEYIEKGMLALGLNPADTKYLIIGHEHGDHYGGQAHFVSNYKTKVVMSDVAWSRMENNELTVFSPRWGPMPKRDITIKDGETISLGDIQVQVYETPGHTPGTISLIFPVFDHGKKHMVSLWGGTGLNYGPDLARIQSYTDAASRFGDITKAQSVDVFLSNHPTRDGSREKLKLMAEHSKDQPHPFVQGQDVVAKAYDMLASCTQAQVLRIQQQEK